MVGFQDGIAFCVYGAGVSQAVVRQANRLHRRESRHLFETAYGNTGLYDTLPLLMQLHFDTSGLKLSQVFFSHLRQTNVNLYLDFLVDTHHSCACRVSNQLGELIY